MSMYNNEAAYPAGRLDKSLLVVGGNKAMYELIGENIYSPLYKIVLERDIDRLKAAAAICDRQETETVEECIHIADSQGRYDTYIIALRRGKDFEGYEADLQNISRNISRIEQIGAQLGILRDYLTINGSALFSYRPADDRFKLFWLDYEQQVEICDMPLSQWQQQMLSENRVNKKDKAAFDAFCEAVRGTEREQSCTFRGSILTWGEKEDTYRVKFLPRTYMGRERVLGVWFVANKQTGNRADGYVEGNYVDSMTKTLNKKGITEYAESKVAKGADIAVFMLDIDNFKTVNDAYGHMFGDKVITAVADVIKKVIGESGVAGRVGGDEFMVILDDPGDELTLRNYLRGIKMNVGALFPDKMGNDKITCSIGVARSRLDSNSFQEMYQIADKALYLAKEKGKNRYIIYKPEIHGELKLNGQDGDLSDIREAFYSEKDLRAFNSRLADLVLKGSGELAEVLEQLAHVLMAHRVLVFWGEERELIGAYPSSLMKERYAENCFEQEEYRKLFKGDILQIVNLHGMEYTLPEAYQLYRANNVCSVMQHYLRDVDGKIKGFVSVEECSQIRGFPKVAVQIFGSMCKVLNAVLLREEKTS